MWWTALILGLTGGLHCLGMCGPLTVAFQGRRQPHSPVITMLTYHSGRVFTYVLLGALFGLVGKVLWIADIQKGLSVVLGLILVIIFFTTKDIDHAIIKVPFLRKGINAIRNFLNRVWQRADQLPTFVVGMANGILPCGLVYIAILGAMAMPNAASGAAFMGVFGVGTIPVFLLSMSGTTALNKVLRRRRWSVQHVLSYVTLFAGLLMIYRGIMIDAPLSMQFLDALDDPNLCH